MKIIGITGGVGSGKTRVMDYIKETYNAMPISADAVAAELEKPGQKCYKSIVAEFGCDILERDGRINRTQLAEIVFSNRQKLKTLNRIVHPEVKKNIIDKIKEIQKEQEHEIILIEAALFFEEGYEKLCDEVWYVYVSEEKRKERLISQRGYSVEKIEKIMDSQLADEQFRNKSDCVIDNNKEFEKTIEQIREELKCQK